MGSIRRVLIRVGIFAALFLFGSARADYIQISVVTSSVSGTDAVMFFDLFDGDGVVNHSVKVFDFTTDGTLIDLPVSDSDVVGMLPGDVIIGDALFQSTYSQNITLGSTLAFNFRILGSQDPAVPPASPDAFEFSLLDLAGNPLLSQIGVLFVYSIGNPDPLDPRSDAVTATVVSEPAAIPEPGALALAVAALLAFGVVRSVRNVALRA